LAVGEFGAKFGAAVAAIELAGRSVTFSSSIVSESSSHSAPLAEICQALFGAAVDCRYMVRGKERYLGQDVPNLKELIYEYRISFNTSGKS
jgi:hypothetical protein